MEWLKIVFVFFSGLHCGACNSYFNLSGHTLCGGQGNQGGLGGRMKSFAMYIPFVICLAILGCATRANYMNRINKWIGQTEESLIGYFGPPASTFEMKNGNKIHTWNIGSSGQSGVIVPVGLVAMTASDSDQCKTSFEVDKISGNVLKTWAEGNCRAYPKRGLP